MTAGRVRVYIRRNPAIIILVTFVLCVATVTVMAVAYRNRQHVNDQRFCTLMHVLLAPGQDQPATARGVQVKQALEDLSHKLGCAHG